MPESITRYYVVHKDSDGYSTNKKHDSLKSAQDEAIRLASGNHGSSFSVLMVVDCYCVNKPAPSRVQIIPEKDGAPQ